MTKGHVYILKNKSMPGLLKIGKTTRSVQQRCDELWQTGVPTSFEVAHSVLSPDCDELESWVHKALSKYRVSDNREFFTVELNDAELALDNGLREQLEAFLDEYLPDQVIANPDFIMDEGDIAFLSYKFDVFGPEIASALSLMEPDEFQPIYERYLALMKTRKEARERGLPVPEFPRHDGELLQ